MNVNPTDVAKKASPICGGKVCYPTQLAAAIALFKIQNKRESPSVKSLGNREHIDMGHTGISHLGNNKKEK